MANKKITDLVEITSAADVDVLAIVDVSADTTNKIKVDNLPVSAPVQTALDAKQATLVSGTNIKTINSTSLLGSGDIAISANPAGSNGQIQFNSSSAFGADSNLFWDNTNKRLGVGTNAPTATTHIKGVDQNNASTSLLVTDSIGTQILRVHNQANNSAVVMSTAKIANYEIISGDVLFNTSMRFVPTTTGLAINKDYSGPAASTLVHIKGSGSTSATTSLLVQNSSNTQIFKVEDGGVVQIGRTDFINWTFSSNTLTSNNYAFIASNNGTIISTGALNGGVQGNNNGGKVSDSGIAVAQVASAVLEVSSTTRGFLPPRMTTTQKNAISSPAAGLQVYDSTLNQMSYYNGSTWVNF